MEKILKLLPILALIYAGNSCYTMYENYEAEIANLNSEIETQNIQKQKNLQTRAEIEEYKKNIEIEKAKIARVEKEIEKIQQLFPSEISDNENITLIRKYAEDVRVTQVTRVAPLGDEDKGFYIARPYHFAMKATYLQFIVFLEKLSDSERIINVRNIDFKVNKDNQKGKYQLIDGEVILETYKFNPNYVNSNDVIDTPAQM